MESLLRPAWQALQENRIQGIRLSTRPDCINGPVLTLLKRMGVSTVELGVQSLDEEVLRQAGRGHTAQDAAEAVRQLREAGFRVGLQFMIGLPGRPMRRFGPPPGAARRCIRILYGSIRCSCFAGPACSRCMRRENTGR